MVTSGQIETYSDFVFLVQVYRGNAAGECKCMVNLYATRSIDTDTDTISVLPNTSSPDFCLDLLRYALTIDAREIEESQSLGINPRFQILSEEAILGIDCLWNRYGYNKSLQTCKSYHEIFRSTLDAILINQGGLAEWMYQSVSKKTRDYVSRKYSSIVEFISRDTVIIQVLQKLEDEGYNLASV